MTFVIEAIGEQQVETLKLLIEELHGVNPTHDDGSNNFGWVFGHDNCLRYTNALMELHEYNNLADLTVYNNLKAVREGRYNKYPWVEAVDGLDS